MLFGWVIFNAFIANDVHAKRNKDSQISQFTPGSHSPQLRGIISSQADLLTGGSWPELLSQILTRHQAKLVDLQRCRRFSSRQKDNQLVYKQGQI